MTDPISYMPPQSVTCSVAREATTFFEAFGFTSSHFRHHKQISSLTAPSLIIGRFVRTLTTVFCDYREKKEGLSALSKGVHQIKRLLFSTPTQMFCDIQQALLWAGNQLSTELLTAVSFLPIEIKNPLLVAKTCLAASFSLQFSMSRINITEPEDRKQNFLQFYNYVKNFCKSCSISFGNSTSFQETQDEINQKLNLILIQIKNLHSSNIQKLTKSIQRILLKLNHSFIDNLSNDSHSLPGDFFKQRMILPLELSNFLKKALGILKAEYKPLYELMFPISNSHQNIVWKLLYIRKLMMNQLNVSPSKNQIEEKSLASLETHTPSLIIACRKITEAGKGIYDTLENGSISFLEIASLIQLFEQLRKSIDDLKEIN